MRRRTAVGSIVLALALCLPATIGRAQSDSKYPDWKGQWVRVGGGQYDPSKPGGRGQAPPLTPEYKAMWDANVASEAAGSPELLKEAPHGRPVRRLDEVRAAKQPVVRYDFGDDRALVEAEQG